MSHRRQRDANDVVFHRWHGGGFVCRTRRPRIVDSSGLSGKTVSSARTGRRVRRQCDGPLGNKGGRRDGEGRYGDGSCSGQRAASRSSPRRDAPCAQSLPCRLPGDHDVQATSTSLPLSLRSVRGLCAPAIIVRQTSVAGARPNKIVSIFDSVPSSRRERFVRDDVGRLVGSSAPILRVRPIVRSSSQTSTALYRRSRGGPGHVER